MDELTLPPTLTHTKTKRTYPTKHLLKHNFLIKIKEITKMFLRCAVQSFFIIYYKIDMSHHPFKLSTPHYQIPTGYSTSKKKSVDKHKPSSTFLYGFQRQFVDILSTCIEGSTSFRFNFQRFSLLNVEIAKLPSKFQHFLTLKIPWKANVEVLLRF